MCGYGVSILTEETNKKSQEAEQNAHLIEKKKEKLGGEFLAPRADSCRPGPDWGCTTQGALERENKK